MKLTRRYLEKLALNDIRNLGRDYGVRCPSMKRKAQTITEILEIQAGTREPYFSNKGRPSATRTEKAKSEEDFITNKLPLIEQLIDECLAEFKRKLMEILST